jgi:ribosomal protein S18 acetylase RimI-like enzyme
MEASLEYKIKTASAKDIDAHLNDCKNNFVPALDKTIDIFEYSKKIAKHSITFEAWFSGRLVGLVAAYLNDTKNKKGFITNVSTSSDFSGIGIGSHLIENCIEYAKRHDFNEISLEVNAGNKSAVKLYEKFDFTKSDAPDENIFMKRVLK